MGDSLYRGMDSNSSEYNQIKMLNYRVASTTGPQLEIKKRRDDSKYDCAHRASCHRCGNLRKKKTLCSQCPYVFCSKCTEKMIEEHGSGIFQNGCPVVCVSNIIFI